jgi:hypothetical protein
VDIGGLLVWERMQVSGESLSQMLCCHCYWFYDVNSRFSHLDEEASWKMVEVWGTREII